MIASANGNPHARNGIDPADCSKMRFACGQCGAVYRASFRLAGRLVRCRHCGSPCHVPHGLPAERTGEARTFRLPPRVAHAKYLDRLEARFVADDAMPASDPTRKLPRAGGLGRLLIAANIAVLIATIVMFIGLARGSSADAPSPPPAASLQLADAGF